MELKIDPKKLQRSTNTNFDEDIAKWNEKKDNMMQIYWIMVSPEAVPDFGPASWGVAGASAEVIFAIGVVP